MCEYLDRGGGGSGWVGCVKRGGIHNHRRVKPVAVCHVLAIRIRAHI